MDFWIKIFTSAHIFLYRLTKGWLGSKLGRQSILLLNTTGQRSGRPYTNTLSYYRDGDRYLIVGSNWGKESQPSWYYNLKKHPLITIQVKAEHIPVHAQPAEGEEYQRLWQLVTEKNELNTKYQKRLQRKIPIFVLTPTKSA